MERKILPILLILGAVFWLSNCGTARYIPAGSQSVGVYLGQFTGTASIRGGTIRIHLYHAPDGTKLFTGSLEQEDTDAFITFRGEVVENSLEGTFDIPLHGTITGQLSEDGSQFKGIYEIIELQGGTWAANSK